MPSPQINALRAQLSDPALSGLVGRFHSHVTVRAAPDALRDFCRGRRLKPTVIDLEDFDGRSQRDIMTTAYHRGPLAAVGAELARIVSALEAAGITVLRVKLEHESLPTAEPFTAHRYREVHVKLAIPEDEYGDRMAALRAGASKWGYVPSRNPNQRREGHLLQFVNQRHYAGTAAQVQAQTDALVASLAEAGLRIIEVKAETAVVDTARSVDAWWA